MLVVAVTGGFGTGKTTVSNMFQELGAEIIDIDFLVFELERPNQSAWEKIVKEFGSKIIKTDKTINRPKLASLVFSNPKLLQKLNSLVHPLVLKKMREEIESFKETKPDALIVVDIPLLFEVKEQDYFKKIIVVKADETVVLERITKNRKLSAMEINQRIQAQFPLEEKASKADFVIDNNNALEKTQEQVKAVFDSFGLLPKPGATTQAF